MRGYVATTDFAWFSFLRARQPPVDEVNFWQPSAHGFRAAPGTPFFFKLKSPHYAIGGFGIFARYAVSGEHSLPVLEAAHIRPYAEEGGTHDVSNGLLLRADIHRLFDRGYVTVTPDLRFVVSPRLAKEFQNGRAYYKRDGQVVTLPKSKLDRPDLDLLRWHNDNVFEKDAA